MNLDRILELLAKQMGNAASDKDLFELEELLKQYPEHQHLVSILKSIQAKKLRQPSQNEDSLVREGWEKLQQKMMAVTMAEEPGHKAPAKKIFLRSWVSRAALVGGIVLVTAVAWFALLKRTPGSSASMAPQVQQAVLPFGKPQIKILHDGSEVWVNAGSSIRYEFDQVLHTRNVYLEGEAYFKVKHDPDHPFIVHAGTIAVRALGTEFNVSAYLGEEKVEATLISGKVQITMAEKPEQKIILIPNEKLTVIKKEIKKPGEEKNIEEISYQVEPIVRSSLANAVPELAWMQDKLAFQNESFDKLAKRMERRYNVHIVFEDPSLKQESLTGMFENENIHKALDLLQMTTPFRYSIRGDSVFLSH